MASAGLPPFVDVIVEVPDEASELLARRAPHQFLDMDTSEPLLCVGGILYKGVLRPLIGTQMIFDKVGKYVGGAEVRVVFSRIQCVDGNRDKNQDGNSDGEQLRKEGGTGKENDAVNRGENVNPNGEKLQKGGREGVNDECDTPTGGSMKNPQREEENDETPKPAGGSTENVLGEEENVPLRDGDDGS